MPVDFNTPYISRRTLPAVTTSDTGAILPVPDNLLAKISIYVTQQNKILISPVLEF